MNSRNKYRTIGLELTVTLDPYTAGDVVGGLLEFSSGDSSGGGITNKLRLVDEDSQPEPYKLYVFREKPSVIANDAVFAPTVADLRKLIAVIPIVEGDYVTINTFDYAHVTLEQPLVFNGNGSLWAYLVADDTPDYANVNTLYLSFDVLQG